jgi:broad specificity phosphatase PhoE
LDVLRHTLRLKPGQQLSRQGIELAGLVRARSGPYARVVSSPQARSINTATAMGLNVDETFDGLARMPSGVLDDWPIPFASVSALVRSSGVATEFANETLGIWRSVIDSVADSERALIITHGGIVELGAVAALPEAPHGDWGGPIGYCEGVRLTFDGHFCSCRILRVPDERRLISC